jgi:predicted regulator of amino acid metabolism with ACT domain
LAKKRLRDLSELDESNFDDEREGEEVISALPARYALFEDFELISLSSAVLSDLLTQASITLEINLRELADAAGVDAADIRRAIQYLQKTGALANVTRRCQSVLTATRGAA